MVAPLKEGPIVVKPSLTSSDPRCAYLSAVACSFSVHPTAADLHRSRSLPHGCTSLKSHGPRREMRIWPLKAILWTGRVVNVTAHACLSPVMKWIWVGAYSVSKAKAASLRFYLGIIFVGTACWLLCCVLCQWKEVFVEVHNKHFDLNFYMYFVDRASCYDSW